MQRWLTVAVASLGIALLGAATPPPAAPGNTESVTIFNTQSAGDPLTPLQTAYVTAKVAQLLDARGIDIDRSTERADSFTKFGDLLCSRAKTALLLLPQITTSVTGREEGGASYNTIRIELQAYDCANKALHRYAGGPNSGYDWTGTADKSIEDALKKYLSGR